MTEAGRATPKHLRILEFMRGYIREHGISPTIDEIREHLGIKSKGGIHACLISMMHRGTVVRTLRHKERCYVPADVGVTVHPSPAEMTRLKRMAAGEGISIERLIERAIREWLAGPTSARGALASHPGEPPSSG